jgi:hypothetical protein
MAQNIPPQDDRDEILEAMKKMLRDSQVVRSGHFIAKQRQERKSQIIGVCVVVLNILIGSGLIETAFGQRTSAIALTIKLLAFLAAALAGIQAFFNFQKVVECHTKSGGVYGSINHRLNLIIAEYQEKPENRNALITNFKTISDEFLKANDDAEACVPTDADFDKARAGIRIRMERLQEA